MRFRTAKDRVDEQTLEVLSKPFRNSSIELVFGITTIIPAFAQILYFKPVVGAGSYRDSHLLYDRQPRAAEQVPAYHPVMVPSGATGHRCWKGRMANTMPGYPRGVQLTVQFQMQKGCETHFQASHPWRIYARVYVSSVNLAYLRTDTPFRCATGLRHVPEPSVVVLA